MAQTTKDYFKSEYNRNLAEAQAITDKVEAEGRSVTSEEKTQVENLVATAQGFKQKLTAIEDNEKLRESIDRMSNSYDIPVEETSVDGTSIGDAFVKSAGFKALVARGLTGTWSTGPIELKATVTTVASPVVPLASPLGPYQILSKKLTVADLLAQGTTDSNTIPVVRETTATNAAAGVAEGAAKPESTLIFTQTTEPVKKIATSLPVSDEFFDDVAGMRSYIDARLRTFVLEAEDTQLLTGAGAGNNVQGIMTRAGVQTGTAAALKTASGAVAPSLADAVYAAMTAIRVNAFAEPDGAVFNPTNWMTIRLLKDSAEQYFGGGPFSGAYGNGGGIVVDSIWGLPVVQTPGMTLHSALVGAFKTQAMIFRKGGLTVEATNSHADDFINNLTRIRAEERLALVVIRPAAFHIITALNV